MRFAFQGYPVRGVGGAYVALVYRPMVLLQAIGPAGACVLYGLADTGSDETLIPEQFRIPLGAVLMPNMRVSIDAVAGGPIAASFGMVDLELRKGSVVHRWAARVGFYSGGKTILGQSAFLEHFTATFNHHRRHFDLRANGTSPAPTVPRP